MNANTQNTVADTILAQLGGASRVSAMTGAKSFLAGKSELAFRFSASKSANYVSIKLDADDTYSVEFLKTRGVKFSIVKKSVNVYAQDLPSLFEEVTGLYLTLGEVRVR